MVDQITIPFTREEWEVMLNNLRWEFVPNCGGEDCKCAVAGNIIDRIQKNLGIE